MLTPTQLKSIASAIRATERDRLGNALPQTTLLNLMTKSLGLGTSFGSYTRRYNTPSTQNVFLLFAFETKDEGCPVEPHLAQAITDYAATQGLQCSFEDTAHGFATLALWALDDARDTAALTIIAQAILELLTADPAAALPVKGHLVWTTNSAESPLIANFRYHDNDQVCSAHLAPNAWANRATLNVNDTQALLLLYGEVEISSYYDHHDITLEDVMTSVDFYEDA